MQALRAKTQFHTKGISSFSASKPQRVLSIPHDQSYSFCLFGRKVPTKVETLAVPTGQGSLHIDYYKLTVQKT